MGKSLSEQIEVLARSKGLTIVEETKPAFMLPAPSITAQGEALDRHAEQWRTRPLPRLLYKAPPLLVRHEKLTPAGYLTGQYALDVALLAKITVKSLAYKHGSPDLDPWALRFSPDDAYIDLSRLDLWSRWKVMWARLGGHYMQDTYGAW